VVEQQQQRIGVPEECGFLSFLVELERDWRDMNNEKRWWWWVGSVRTLKIEPMFYHAPHSLTRVLS